MVYDIIISSLVTFRGNFTSLFEIILAIISIVKQSKNTGIARSLRNFCHSDTSMNLRKDSR
jgi:hypothetical protein